MERIQDGTQKGVFRVHLRGGESLIVYVWSAEENLWPSDAGGERLAPWHPFAPACGADLFAAAAARLHQLGVSTPRVHLVDTTRTVLPFDVAVVEDAGTRSLADDWSAVTALAPELERLHAASSYVHGKVAHLGTTPTPQTAVRDLVTERALVDITFAARQLDGIGQAHSQLTEHVSALASAVDGRTDYRLIHGELGPDHVLIGRTGRPALIDIEGLMFFDLEWEHSYLELRFGEHYVPLRPSQPLDPARMALYRLCHHLSLCAGPLRLLQGRPTNRAFIESIIRWNEEQALSCLDA